MPTNLRIATRSLRVHRMRSTLTMLGIIIGVAAVVVMISVGTGARERISDQIRILGANLISVHPGSASLGGVRLGRGAAPQLGEDDASAIAREVPGVEFAAPVLYGAGQFTVGATNWQGAIRGVTPAYLSARDWGVTAGRELTEEDHLHATRVVLLGATMREKLFQDADPLDTTIRIRDLPFVVVGLLQRKGQSVWGDDQDDVALVPLSTARRHLIGVNRANPTMVHNITVKFIGGASAENIMTGTRDLLRQRHRLQPGREDSFLITNLAEAAEVEASATDTVSLLLSSVALVSLVVGGIGIMNIMLVTVTERTREIGLRLAVGARQRDILSQFLVEAVVLAVLGGILGIILGVAVSIAIGTFAGWPVIIDLSALLLAVGSAAAVGVLFGYYPARKAARRSPIEALRFE